MLLTHRVERVVDTIEQLYELTSRILLYNLIKALNIDKNDGDLSLSLREVLLAILDPRPDKARNQQVDNRLELLQLLDVPELRHKAYLLLDLVPVSVVRPEEDVQGDGQGLPNQLN